MIRQYYMSKLSDGATEVKKRIHNFLAVYGYFVDVYRTLKVPCTLLNNATRATGIALLSIGYWCY